MNKTIDQILNEIHRVKPLSRGMLYIYIKRYGIKPVGENQRPQRYPADTTAQILQHLGIQADTTFAEIISVTEAKRRARKGGK